MRVTTLKVKTLRVVSKSWVCAKPHPQWLLLILTGHSLDCPISLYTCIQNPTSSLTTDGPALDHTTINLPLGNEALRYQGQPERV